MTVSSHSKPVRVCFVSPKAYPLFNPAADGVIGGAEVDLYLLATELAKDSGFDVSCITADYAQPAEETIENVRVIKSLDFKQNQITSAIKIWKALKRADADVYMLETLSLGIVLLALFSRLYKRVFVYRTASQLECNGYYLNRNRLYWGIVYRFMRSANAVVVQNLSDKKLLLSNAKIDAKVIANGQIIPETITSQKKTVLWVGRSVNVKRPELFLEMAKRSEAEFVMICQKATGDENYDDLVAMAKEIPNLNLLEGVPFKDVDSFFRDAKVLVNTSDSEGFPNTFIQACKASTPILSLNVNPDGFLDENRCGVCCDGDMDEMVAQIKVFTTTKIGEDMGSNGRDYVEQTHDVAKLIEQYKEMFVKLKQEKGK
ncbi:MAG: glycosyltransferase family 4 protein [Phycisphaerae bacterium]|nr:glycosyltransferase family 4 protein [Phycisphaerae bacterium]